MKLTHLKNIIKEELKTLKEQGGTNYTAAIQCMPGFYVKISNPNPGVSIYTGTPNLSAAGPHAMYSKALGDDICFTCVPVPPVDHDRRAPMEPTVG